MSVPDQAARSGKNNEKSLKNNEKSFYGRSYPRAALTVKPDGQTSCQDKAISAIAPLLDWAKKADWKNGGGKQKSQIPFPKPPYTPLYAFLAAKQLRIKKQNPTLSSSETLVLAKADAAAEWEKLSDKEQTLYVAMAQSDAERYENEASAFQKKYPELWAQKKERKPRGVKLRTKPKAAKTAWRVFLEECVSKAIEEGNISEDAKGLQKQVEVMKDAVAAWKELSEDERQPYKDRAEEDKKRYEAELEEFPVLKAELAAKAAAHVEAKKQKAAKKAIYDEAKPNAKTKSKSKTKGARKRTLPKPKPILPKSKPLVKRGKYVGTGAEDVERPRTRSTRTKIEEAAEEEDMTEGAELAASASEAGDSDVEYDDNSDTGEESEEEAEDESEEEEEEPADEEEGPIIEEISEPELSDDEHADKENAPPLTVQRAMRAVDFVADTPAAVCAPSDDEEEEDDDALRVVAKPEDLVKSNNGQKETGILSWARSALMSGFKGMWARGGSQPIEDASSKKAGTQTPGTSKKRKR